MPPDSAGDDDCDFPIKANWGVSEHWGGQEVYVPTYYSDKIGKSGQIRQWAGPGPLDGTIPGSDGAEYYTLKTGCAKGEFWTDSPPLRGMYLNTWNYFTESAEITGDPQKTGISFGQKVEFRLPFHLTDLGNFTTLVRDPNVPWNEWDKKADLHYQISSEVQMVITTCFSHTRDRTPEVFTKRFLVTAVARGLMNFGRSDQLRLETFTVLNPLNRPRNPLKGNYKIAIPKESTNTSLVIGAPFNRTIGAKDFEDFSTTRIPGFSDYQHRGDYIRLTFPVELRVNKAVGECKTEAVFLLDTSISHHIYFRYPLRERVRGLLQNGMEIVPADPRDRITKIATVEGKEFRHSLYPTFDSWYQSLSKTPIVGGAQRMASMLEAAEGFRNQYPWQFNEDELREQVQGAAGR